MCTDIIIWLPMSFLDSLEILLSRPLGWRFIVDRDACVNWG